VTGNECSNAIVAGAAGSPAPGLAHLAAAGLLRLVGGRVGRAVAVALARRAGRRRRLAPAATGRWRLAAAPRRPGRTAGALERRARPGRSAGRPRRRLAGHGP